MTRYFKEKLLGIGPDVICSLRMESCCLPTLIVQWLCHQLMGWKVLGLYLGTGFNPMQGSMGRYKVTTPSSLSLTSNRVTTTNY